MPRLSLEKLGTGGALLAALACPVCFPKFALIGAALGLGVLAPFEGYTALAVQGLFVVAWLGHVIAFRRHRNRVLLAFATIVTLLLFVGSYVYPSAILLQSALLGLVVASGWLILSLRHSPVASGLMVIDEPAAGPTAVEQSKAGHR